VKALEGRRLVAVAGSHGKTTTSAMVATALHGAGIDASFAVGARVFGVEGAVAGGYGGTSDVAVVEADESDGSFLRYRPAVGIITNIEIDHLDHYGTEAALIQAFAEFASQCDVLVVCSDDPRAAALARDMAASPSGVRVITYGIGTADVTVADGTVLNSGIVSRNGVEYALTLPVPGAHNRLNAAAAWVAAVEMGADPAAAARALASFAGTGRRYQVRGHARGITVIDDYAHHPTEVAALLAAARHDSSQRLVVLFQPALFSRTQMLGADFGAALSAPNTHVVLAPVHGDREDPIEGVTSQLIADAVDLKDGQSLVMASSLEEAASLAADAAVSGDVVLTVGSGTVTEAAQWILDVLQARGGPLEGESR
jgi:UDP-N-acetylmuramate--alanine ligase